MGLFLFICYMKTRILTILLLTTCFGVVSVSAQDVQNNYQQYKTAKTLDGAYTGSIYLFEDGKMASVLLESDQILRVKLKYNLLEDIFYVQGTDGKTVVFTQPYNQVVLDLENDVKLVFKRFVNATGKSAFFQVLFDGKVQLLRKYSANFVEVLDYNEVSPKKKVTKQTSFFTQLPNKEMLQLKVSKKGILNFMADKKLEIDSFLAKENIDLKDDLDLVRLFNYYNTLL